MWRWLRAVMLTMVMMAAASGLAVAAGHVGLTSDDGLRIVFRSWSSGEDAIYIVKPDGSDLTKIFAAPAYYADCSLYSNQIIIAETDVTGTRIENVVSITADGKQYQNLFTEGYYFASFSPDGASLAMDTQYGFSPTSYPHRLIVTSTADGSVRFRSETMSSLFLQPAWSPDGRQIAFVARSGQDMLQSDIALADLENGQIRFITDTPDMETSPEWSPDGRRIIFTRNRYLYTMNADGGNVARLTSDGDSILPAWSPDGRRIAYSNFESQDTAVYVMDADGNNRHLLADLPGKSDMVACWLYVQNYAEGN